MRRLLGSRVTAAAVAGLLALLAAAGGYALASPSGTITACVHEHGGALYVGKCARGDKKLGWNIQGPQGKQGVQGIQGIRGIQGSRGSKATPGPRARRMSLNAKP